MLVVDDEPKNLIAIEAILRPIGVEVELAHSAADALRMLLRRPPTLLILDVQMPVMDGFEAARLIRERDATRHLPIIFLTAQNTDSKNVFQGYSLGAVDYLFKPFDAAMLRSKVAVFVELERRGQRLHEQEIALERERANRRLGALAGVLMRYLESADWSASAQALLALAIDEAHSACGFIGTLVSGVGVRVWANQGWHPQPGNALADDRASVNFGTVGEQPRGPAAIRALFTGTQARAFDRLDAVVAPVLGGSASGPVLVVPIRSGGETAGVLAVGRRAGEYTREEREALEALGHAASVVHEVEVRRAHESALSDQLRQSQKMEAVGNLAGGIAHDFNNLLTVINGYADFALSDEGLPQQVKDDMLCVRDSGRRAAALTRQLLAFSRRQVLDLRPVGLDEIVKQSEKMYRRLLSEDIQLTCIAAPQPWKVMADPGQIDQILINLVVNARDALGSGGKIVIETSNHYLDQAYADQVPDNFRAGEYVMLAVSDTGAGIPKDVLPRIFEPFFTTKPRDKGTGLGLSTVYGIVKQMHGHIWVYTESGKGTTFKIYLPRTGGDEVAVTTERAPAAEASGLTVLMIEDDVVLSRLCKRMLTSGGYTVLEASTADDALEIAKAHPEIGALLVDVVLAGTTGPQVVERIARVRPGVTTLYMSGYTEHASLERGDLAQGASFIQKPFTRDVLLDRLGQALAQRQEA